MKEEQIQTLHPQPGKTNKRIALQKYNTIKENLLKILAKKELTHTELMEKLYSNVKDTFEGGVQWYGETVKLDLEARKIIERTNTKPEKYKLKASSDVNIKKVVQQLIKATNAFDVKGALALFAADAVIDDVSVGEKFKKTAGVRKYLEKFFVGYHTVTKLESLKSLAKQQAEAHCDFTGDFGHETGVLKVTVNADGLIIAIDAFLD